MARCRAAGRVAVGVAHRRRYCRRRGRVSRPGGGRDLGPGAFGPVRASGRFALIDSDGSEASRDALPAALAIGVDEPQIALREGVALVPRLARMSPGKAEEVTPAIDPERTVLITGATGILGSLVARHLTDRH